MALPGNITSSNAIYTIVVDSVFPTPQVLQGYSADAAFETESVDIVESVIGVDKFVSYGFVPALTMQTITIQASSPSAYVFDTWFAAMKRSQTVFLATGNIILPSLQQSYSLTRGALVGVVAMPSARRTLQSRAFRLNWQDISPAPYIGP